VCVNFDEPASLEHRLLFTHVSELAVGRPINKPVYDFARHVRSQAVERVEPAPFVIVEGLFTFHWAELRRLFGVRVFIEVPDDIGFARRADRDVRERGRSPESVLVQYNETVRPMASLYVIPTRRYADVIVSGEEPLDDSTATVLAFVNKATGAAGSPN
jgi:uridine kinase